jgi:hypothetical protein
VQNWKLRVPGKQMVSMSHNMAAVLKFINDVTHIGERIDRFNPVWSMK